MMLGDILHVAIRTVDLGTTVGFYCDALGLKEVVRPAGLRFPGAWLALPHAGDKAVVHVYALTAAEKANDQIATDNEKGSVDHVAFRGRGFTAYRTRLRELGLTFREQHLNESTIWQIFVHDPNGVKVELSFNQSEETDLPVSISDTYRYVASERFFNPSEYARFDPVKASG
ncbi:VOC family protein [Paraburkholderia terrae]|uniref:VOC family protein n=1 Tax=Paraburkholderia terrae TaxID=311230 RepID=UPI0030E4CE2A